MRQGSKLSTIGAVLAFSICFACTSAGAAAGPDHGLDASLGSLPDRSAHASGASGVLTLNGSAVASRTTVSIDPDTAELVIRDPTGINPPGDPCTPPPGTAVTEVRCPPGVIGAIVGNLAGGGDRFVTERSVRILIGAQVGGRLKALHGGPGADRLAGGAVGDALFGDGGKDQLIGRRNPDLLNGGLGADSVFGGLGADGLFGGAGADLLGGGAGRDFCKGGAGSDRFRSCALTR
jgi:Ca2+-binding RTX toxin-like protein